MKTTKPWTPAGDPEGINRWWRDEIPQGLKAETEIPSEYEVREVPGLRRPYVVFYRHGWDPDYEACPPDNAVSMPDADGVWRSSFPTAPEARAAIARYLDL